MGYLLRIFWKISAMVALLCIWYMSLRISELASTESVPFLGRLLHFILRKSLRWRHNDQDGVSNHQPHGCLLNRLFRRRSNKTSKLRVTGLCVGNSPGPVNSPHKGPVTRKMFPFDDVIMIIGTSAKKIHYLISMNLTWLTRNICWVG